MAQKVQQEIFVTAHKVLVGMKAYHYRTQSAARHKQADAFIAAFSDAVDRLLETLQGVTGKHMDMRQNELLRIDYYDDATVPNHLRGLQVYFEELQLEDRGATAICDEIQALCSQTAYLMSFN